MLLETPSNTDETGPRGKRGPHLLLPARLDVGGFVLVGHGVEVHQDGLVHVSQLADKFVKDPHEVVKAGDVVKVRVVEVDVQRKRIGLTMRKDIDTTAPRDRPRDHPLRTNQRPPQQAPRSTGTLGDMLNEAMRKKK